MQELIAALLKQLGEDPARPGLQGTPLRAEKALKYLTSGYHADLKAIVNGAIYAEPGSEMIIAKDIEFYSLCEHHLLPFFGKCHIGYIPDGKVLGLSKLPRVVNMFARRLQTQERLTSQVAETINSLLKPKGVAVIMDANHLCIRMRGVEKQNASIISSSVLGTFRADPRTRAEFFSLLERKP